MKTPFLVVSFLAWLLPTSLSGKHLLIETVDKKDDPVKATPADKSNKAGSDYMACGFLWFTGCPDVQEKLPLDDNGDGDATMLRTDAICSGNSRHGAPCTTFVVFFKCLEAYL